MLTATIFGIFFTPLFYAAARQWLSRKKTYSEEEDLQDLEERRKDVGNDA
jgi:multidrug efflux pump